MTNTFRDKHYSKCIECSQSIRSMKPEFVCESCRNSKNLIRKLGWAAIMGISVINPSLSTAAVGLMTSIETNLLGNPNEKKIYDLHTQVEKLNRATKTKDFEYLRLQEQVSLLEKSNIELQQHIQQRNFMSDLHIAGSNPWLLQIATNPDHYGIIRLERVNMSTRFEYIDYPLHIDFFVADTEGRGLLHGGIPIDVISPMMARSKMRKPMLYSYKRKDISHPVDVV
jgi:hypothetical protein